MSTEVIIVDNDSEDNTVAIVSQLFPSVKILKQHNNLGFGQANNIGLAEAQGTYILLLNPDTKINTKAIDAMTDFLNSHPQVGAVGPEQFNGEGNMIFTTSRLSLRGILEFEIEKLYAVVIKKPAILFPWPYRTSMLNAGCVMLRSDILHTKQWFDPDMFIYGEERHLFRQIHKKGWEVYFLRDCSIYHYRETSIAKTGKKWKFVKDSLLVTLKNIIG